MSCICASGTHPEVSGLRHFAWLLGNKEPAIPRPHQYQHGALTKPHSWFHLRDGCMEMLDKRRRLCNVEKVRAGTVL